MVLLVCISNVKVDARHNTSARRLPHAVSKPPEWQPNPFSSSPSVNVEDRQRLYARGQRGYDTSPVDRNLKEKREPKPVRSSSSSSTRCGGGGGSMFASTLIPACLDRTARTPSCQHVGVPVLRPQPLPNSCLARGNGVEHAPVRDVAAADGFPTTRASGGGWGGWR